MDSATQVLALRHGQTAWNVLGRMQGHLDIPLNERGLWEAQQLAQALSASAQVDQIFSSDLTRAADTAQAAAALMGLPVTLTPGLRERHFGAFQGYTGPELEARWPQDYARWRSRDPDFAPEGGESLREFSQRVVATVRDLAARHPGQTVALFAHGGVLDCLYRCAVGLDLQAPRTWLLGNASINRLLCHQGCLTLVGWNDAAHLGEWTGAATDDQAHAGPLKA